MVWSPQIRGLNDSNVLMIKGSGMFVVSDTSMATTDDGIWRGSTTILITNVVVCYI